MNIVLLLLVLLLSLGVAAGEVFSIDMHNLSFWLLLAVAPGIVMLVALGIHYRGNPRINAKPSAPIEPLAEVEPDELERLKRNAIEQLSVISAVLRSSTATTLIAEQTSGQAASSATGQALLCLQDCDGSRDSTIATERFDKPVDTREETVSQTHLLELSSVIEATRHVTRDKALSELAAKMRIMAELTSRLNDKRQTLNHIPIGPLSASDNTAPHRHYLSFTLGNEPFAVSTLSIYGVVEATQLITESSMPSKLRRAIRLRDALVPVIDLGAQLGGQPIEIGWGTSIVILEVTSRDRLQMIGVVVNAVGKVLEILPEEIEPPAASDSKIHNDFTLGTVTVNNHTVTLLDIGRGLSANEFVVLRSAAQSVAQENLST
jgi:chemotaxis signal transduction protein